MTTASRVARLMTGPVVVGALVAAFGSIGIAAGQSRGSGRLFVSPPAAETVVAGSAAEAVAGGATEPSPQEDVPPIIDMHLHALSATSQGPPPLALCPGAPPMVFDQRTSWAEQFLGAQKEPPCDDPILSPMTDEELMTATLEVMERRNIIGLTSSTPQRVQPWRAAAPERIIPSLAFRLTPTAQTPERVRQLYESGTIRALAEVTNQYVGIEPDDPRFDPYLALAEELDMPVGIHIGTGPPGAPYLPGMGAYRARFHSPLSLEEPLLKYPRLRIFVMHAGWPMLDDTLALMWAHPQVHLEVGVICWALPRAEFHRYLRTLVEAGFGKRIMFGSDHMVWPGMIEVGIESIESAEFLTDEQKRDILYNNAARFLRLESAGAQ